MIFETLYDSAERNELLLVSNGLCHFHLRCDEQLTIREIIVLPKFRRQGIGTLMLNMLKAKSPKSIFAKCPTDLIAANRWYQANGFELEDVEIAKSGRKLNHWRLIL